jgi:hypothetical protein
MSVRASSKREILAVVLGRLRRAGYRFVKAGEAAQAVG